MARVLIRNFDNSYDGGDTPGKNLARRYMKGMVVGVVEDEVPPGAAETPENGFWVIQITGAHVSDWNHLLQHQECLASEAAEGENDEEGLRYMVRRRRSYVDTSRFNPPLVNRLNSGEIVEMSAATFGGYVEALAQPVRQD